MQEYAVSIDPGYRTGYVVATWVDKDTFTILEANEFHWQQRLEFLKRILSGRSLTNGKLFTREPHILCEAFRLYSKSSRTMVNSTFEAVQVIGNLQAIAWGLGYSPSAISMRPAMDKMNVEILPEDRRFFVGQGEHSRDAYKLFRYWWRMYG